MRKLILTALALPVAALAMTACGSSTPDAAKTPAPAASTPTTKSTPAPTGDAAFIADVNALRAKHGKPDPVTSAQEATNIALATEAVKQGEATATTWHEAGQNLAAYAVIHSAAESSGLTNPDTFTDAYIKLAHKHYGTKTAAERLDEFAKQGKYDPANPDKCGPTASACLAKLEAQERV